MPQWMTMKDKVLELIIYQFRRAVVIRFYLVTDDFHLLINLSLRIDTMKDYIRKKAYSPWKMFLQDSRIIHCIGLSGKCIQITSHLLKTVYDV